MMRAAVTAFALLLATLASANPDFDRTEWPHWISVHGSSVRLHVLLRDAVEAGRWIDPYTGKEITDPKAIDIDHLVPLAAAYEAGGSTWTREQRQAYANNLRYRWHLIAVSASANRAKGARGPEEWVPANEAFWCQYGESWASVSVVWRLEVSEARRAAIEKLLERC
jgi:hypothetical protein